MSTEDTQVRRLAAIMFTDMVGYSALSQRNEALALELLEDHRRILRSIFPVHQGNEIKTTGDGFMVEFTSVLAAVECAVKIQEALLQRNRVEPPDRRVEIRVGIHVGDVVWKQNDLFGDGVNIASRIEALAEPGGICISEDVARQIQNRIDHRIIRMGPSELKNIQLPMVIYRLMPACAEEQSQRFGPWAKRATRRLRPLALPAAIALLILLSASAAVWFTLQSRNSRPQAEPGSIAVLPFVNMSSNSANDYLSDGLTEEIINSLDQVKGLRVPSRTAVFALKGKNEGIQEIADRLRVRQVLEGSVRQSGNRVRITIKLISAADGYQLWSETFERELGDELALETEIARQVSDRVANRAATEAWGGLAALQDTDR